MLEEIKMTNSGIYKLEFSDGSYYIGQSVDISSRFRDHYRMVLAGNHHSYKVQNKYDELRQLPKHIVVEYCPKEHLNTKEDLYIKLDDPKCLNIKAGGDSNFGINAPTAKYDILDLEVAFLLLVEYPGILHREVAAFSGIDINTVHDISAGRSRAYTELKALYPDKYDKLIKMKAPNTRGKYTTIIKHTDGREVSLVTGEYSAFCTANGLQSSNLSKVIKGHRKSTMGWSLVRTYENV